jgi:hypothetical protein
MKSHASGFAALALGLFVLAVGCTTTQEIKGPDNHAIGYVDADGGHPTPVRDTLHNPFPHLLMADGRLSANDRCPVRKVPLNKRLPAMFVNGRAIGFC